MSRAERTIIGVAISVICPASLLVLCCWVAASLSIYHVLRIPESGIAIAAFTGLGIGVILDIFGLKKGITKFYHINIKLMILAYLFWSAIAVALLMGLPLLNIALGILAGLYIGRRQHHAGVTTDMFAKAARGVSLFTAVVTGAEALPIGLLGLKEQMVGEALRSVGGLDPSTIAGPIGVVLISVLCVILMAVQFWCTKTGAAFAFKLGKKVA